jgi:hypothetical protein
MCSAHVVGKQRVPCTTVPGKHLYSMFCVAKPAHVSFVDCSMVIFLSSPTSSVAHLLDMVDCSLQMMKKRHKIERDLSIGEEVGWSKNQQVAKSNPTLAAMNKKFGMIHGLSSLANIMSFGSLAMHSWYLASKIEL